MKICILSDASFVGLVIEFLLITVVDRKKLWPWSLISGLATFSVDPGLATSETHENLLEMRILRSTQTY